MTDTPELAKKNSPPPLIPFSTSGSGEKRTLTEDGPIKCRNKKRRRENENYENISLQKIHAETLESMKEISRNIGALAESTKLLAEVNMRLVELLQNKNK